MPSFNYMLHRPTGDLELLVSYDVTPGSRGARDSLGGIPGAGPPLEPDEDDEIEIDDWQPRVDLTEEEYDKLYLACKADFWACQQNAEAERDESNYLGD